MKAGHKNLSTVVKEFLLYLTARADKKNVGGGFGFMDLGGGAGAGATAAAVAQKEEPVAKDTPQAKTDYQMTVQIGERLVKYLAD